MPRDCGGKWVRSPGGPFDFFFVKAVEIRFCCQTNFVSNKINLKAQFLIVTFNVRAKG